MQRETMEWVDKIKFDSNGLVPAIIQDYRNGEVLMLAYMSRESVLKSLSSGITCFFSRSRQSLWVKGESSGHVQTIREIYIDCDRDALLFKVDQAVAACHTGYRSCFYRRIEGEELKTVGIKVFDEEAVYKQKG
ncbi:MAG: phosphoribosyl-AMP cyclohydrolase [Deltaproteobacteria bacterium]|nr:phosphoribosyl-AMP cyclohydrolase [Deltaproteobacteria bacterium]